MSATAHESRYASHRIAPPSARYHCTACAIVARTNHAMSFRIARAQPFLLPGIEFGSHEPVSMCTVCKDTNSMTAPPQHSTARPHLTYRNIPQDPRATNTKAKSPSPAPKALAIQLLCTTRDSPSLTIPNHDVQHHTPKEPPSGNRRESIRSSAILVPHVHSQPVPSSPHLISSTKHHTLHMGVCGETSCRDKSRKKQKVGAG